MTETLFVIAYFLPSMVAVLRRHSDIKNIALANLLFGWTGIGWAVTLGLSLSEFVRIESSPPIERPEDVALELSTIRDSSKDPEVIRLAALLSGRAGALNGAQSRFSELLRNKFASEELSAVRISGTVEAVVSALERNLWVAATILKALDSYHLSPSAEDASRHAKLSELEAITLGTDDGISALLEQIGALADLRLHQGSIVPRVDEAVRKLRELSGQIPLYDERSTRLPEKT